MPSDEAPLRILNVACRGCQDEMRSTSDTHELETIGNQAIGVMHICMYHFPCLFCLNVNDWLLGLSFNIGAGGGV